MGQKGPYYNPLLTSVLLCHSSKRDFFISLIHPVARTTSQDLFSVKWSWTQIGLNRQTKMPYIGSGEQVPGTAGPIAWMDPCPLPLWALLAAFMQTLPAGKARAVHSSSWHPNPLSKPGWKKSSLSRSSRRDQLLPHSGCPRETQGC